MWDFEAIGLPALNGELTALEEGLGHPERGLSLLAPKLGADIRKNFDDGGRPEAWPDITAQSRAQRKVNTASGPLIDSGTLEAAASSAEPGEGSLYSLQGDTLTLGTDLVYAATQEFGGRGIPARPYEQITDTDALRLAGTFESEYLHALLAGEAVL